MAKNIATRQQSAPAQVHRAPPPARRDDEFMRRVQIAKQFPRDLERAKEHLKIMAPANTERWAYTFPVKNNRTGKTTNITGPSVKCTNDVLAQIDNVEVKIEVVDEPDAFVFNVGIFDLERNSTFYRAFRQRRSQGVMGGDDDGRREDMVFQIGQSKAIRNAVANYFAEVVQFAFKESQGVLLARIKENLEVDRRTGHTKGKAKDAILQRLEQIDAPIARVVHWLGVGEKKWTAENLATIQGAISAIVDGITTVEKIWPDPEIAAGPPKKAPPATGAQRDDPPPSDTDDPGPEPGSENPSGPETDL